MKLQEALDTVENLANAAEAYRRLISYVEEAIGSDADEPVMGHDLAEFNVDTLSVVLGTLEGALAGVIAERLALLEAQVNDK